MNTHNVSFAGLAVENLKSKKEILLFFDIVLLLPSCSSLFEHSIQSTTHGLDVVHQSIQLSFLLLQISFILCFIALAFHICLFYALGQRLTGEHNGRAILIRVLVVGPPQIGFVPFHEFQIDQFVGLVSVIEGRCVGRWHVNGFCGQLGELSGGGGKWGRS